MKKSPLDLENPDPTSLSGFVTGLLQDGRVVLSPELVAFEPPDRQQVEALLRRYHDWDIFHQPMRFPDYEPGAAVWAAEYLYRALQFLLLRHLGAEMIPVYLKPYDGPQSPEAVYSADLLLRNLPHVYNLARSLSPSDPLVLQMQELAPKWAFSTIGIPFESEVELPEHPGLQLAFADRVITARDRKLARLPALNMLIQSALGSHGAVFWPDFEAITHPQPQFANDKY